LDEKPVPQARFASLDAPLSDAKILAALKKDFAEWAFREGKATVRANESLKVYAGPDVSPADFRQMCSEAARDQRDAETKKVSDAFDRKVDALQEKLSREQRELEQDESRLSQRRLEEMGTHAENVLGMFLGKRSSRRVSSSLTKRRMTADASAEVKESETAITDMQKQLAALEKEKAQAIEEVEQRWGEIASQIDEITVAPLKKDVSIELFGVAWFPYHLIQTGDQLRELPGFGAD
jgi:hypothetical protein